LGGFAIGARVALLWQHNANAKCRRVLVVALCRLVVIVVQEDPSDCGRACGLVRPTVVSVLILTALTLAVTVVVVGGRAGVH